MKQYLSLVFIAFSISFCAAQHNSSIDFVIRNVGIGVDGHFNSFSISTTFDKANKLEKLSAAVEVKSIETGIDSRDEHLLEEDYFNVSKFPTITLKTITLEKVSTNEYTAKVNLTIKGKTQQITIPLTVEILESSRKITSEFEINRRDFSVGGRSLVMSNTVKISVVHINTIDGNN